MSRPAVLCAALCAVVGLASHASATITTYGFQCITNANATNASAGSAQLWVEVEDVGANQVSFTFHNSGPVAMSITDVYFDDGTLLGIASITNQVGVDFAVGASPPNMPGGNLITPMFQTTAGFSADSNPPAQPNGVNPGEWVRVTFNLLDGITYADTITALNTPGDYLRIGIHVQAIGLGGSESFINTVPGPGAIALVGAAVPMIARRRRR